MAGYVAQLADGGDGGPSPGPSGPPREFPLYQRGPPQEYLDRLAEKRRVEEVSGIVMMSVCGCVQVSVHVDVCGSLCGCVWVCVCGCVQVSV